MRRRTKRCGLHRQFQSAPDREVGRCPTRVTHRHPESEFQSAPDREVGRCPPDADILVALVIVSIRARP